MSKNKMPERKPVADIKIDEKEPVKAERMTQKEGQAIVDAYKANCEKFPARMPKWERKKDALKEWVESLPKK